MASSFPPAVGGCRGTRLRPKPGRRFRDCTHCTRGCRAWRSSDRSWFFLARDGLGGNKGRAGACPILVNFVAKRRPSDAAAGADRHRRGDAVGPCRNERRPPVHPALRSRPMPVQEPRKSRAAAGFGHRRPRSWRVGGTIGPDTAGQKLPGSTLLAVMPNAASVRGHLGAAVDASLVAAWAARPWPVPAAGPVTNAACPCSRDDLCFCSGNLRPRLDSSS
jgi:hypothetical protein